MIATMKFRSMKFRSVLGNWLGSAGVLARHARRLAGHMLPIFYGSLRLSAESRCGI